MRRGQLCSKAWGKKTAVSQCQGGLTRNFREVVINAYISCIEIMEIWSIGFEKVPTSAEVSLAMALRVVGWGRSDDEFVKRFCWNQPLLLYSKNINSTEHQDPNVPSASVNRLGYIYHNEKLTIDIFQAGDTFSEPSLFRKAFINFWVWTYTYIFTYTVYIQHTADGRNTAPLGMYKNL